jgi:dTDP-D-glucose 4,6-dehydratase
MLKKKTVLITGGGGFLGKNLINWFLGNTDYNLISIERNLSGLVDYTQRVTRFRCDLTKEITDIYITKALVNVDYVVHLAGDSDVLKSFKEPAECLQRNQSILLNTLEYFRANKKNLKKLLFISTAEVHGASEDDCLFQEEHPINPLSPYAMSKATSESICDMYFRLYKVPTTIVRVMNIFGKHQSESKFIPKLISSIEKEDEVSIHLNFDESDPLRNYLDAEDFCEAIDFLLRKGEVGEKYNIVSKDYTSNLEIAKTLAILLKKPLYYRLITPKEKRCLSLLDDRKLVSLGWNSKISLEEGLRRLIDER